MSLSKPIRRVGVVGTGVIGASWVTHYLSRGFEVVATDPAPNAESNLRKYVDQAWQALGRAGLVTGTSGVRLSFFPSLDDAIANADFVQKRSRTPGLQSTAVRPNGRCGTTGFNTRIKLIRYPVGCYSVGMRASGALRDRPSLQSSAHRSNGRSSRRSNDLRGDN
jgi:3-hydroxyacyl-CoA dehydrogenase, NAD binding domain